MAPPSAIVLTGCEGMGSLRNYNFNCAHYQSKVSPAVMQREPEGMGSQIFRKLQFCTTVKEGALGNQHPLNLSKDGTKTLT